MKPQDQLVLKDPEKGLFGDCMRACLASLLNLEASMVPHFLQEAAEAGEADLVLDYINAWLAPQGLCYVEVFATPPVYVSPDCFYIRVGTTDRGSWLHAVVALDGQVVHDPHPSRAGILKTRRLGFLVKLC